MKNFRLLYAVFLLLLSYGLRAQITVRGTVKSSADGEALIGATILVKGTATGTSTDTDGSFSISVPDNKAVLQVSYTGFNSLDVPIGSQTSLDIKLEAAAALLDEFVTVAYGTVKKEALTGSVGTIKAEQIGKRPINNITAAIEGAIPGVITQTANGQPGSGLSIRIRGFGSINATSEPLFVVDGVPYIGGTSNINPDDVESISILKDASATALYGSRAANGVVIITTKKGKMGSSKHNVSVKVTQGVASRGLPEYERVDAFQYYPLMWEQYRNSLVYPISGPAISRDSASRVASGLTSRTSIGTLLAYNPFNVPARDLVSPSGQLNSNAQLIYADDLDWTKDLLRAGDRKDYNVNFNGGGDKFDYFLSVGYLEEDGYTLNTDFQRYSARLNVNIQPYKWLKNGLNIAGNHSVSNTARDGGSTNFVNPFFFSRNIGPIYPVFAHNMTTGEYLLDANGQRFWDLGNLGSSGLGIPNRPSGGFAGRHALAETTLNSQLFTRTVASLRNSTDLFFLKNFKFTNNVSVDFQYQNDNSFDNPVVGDGAPAGRSSRDAGSNIALILSQLLSYNKNFGQHGIDLLVGHESYNQRQTAVGGFKQGQSLSGNTELGNFTTINSSTSSLDLYTIESYLSRANYNYKGKYLLSGSFRRDGNSRFAPESRWGTFWSVGTGWNIDKEPFLSDVKWLDQLKLRSSYGVVGVADGIGFYAYQGLYNFNNNANEPGIVQSQTAFLNRDLTWENNEQFDVGVDFTLFKGRISGSVEYYSRVSRDLLFAVPQPLSSGALSVNQNTATMTNDGIEANLDVEFIRTRDFSFSTNFNISTVQNVITKMPETVPEFITGTKKYSVGFSIFDYWLRSYYGVDPSDGAALYKADNKRATSGLRFITNASGGIDTVTTLVANGKFEYNGSVIPKFYGSIQPSITFKGVTLTTLLTFQVGGLTYDGLYQSLMSVGGYGGAWHKDITGRWQNEGDISNIPRLDAGRSTDFNATSSRWLVDASYLNIRSVTASYNLPRSLMSKLKIVNAQVFAGAENVAFFSKRVGMNNQQNFSGVTSNAYPPARVISGGINVTF